MGSDTEFQATHVIQTATRRWYVRNVDGVLYTRAEWDSADNADWTLDEDGEPLFQGERRYMGHFPTVETFEDCHWTRTDGWNDDGTPGPDAQF